MSVVILGWKKPAKGKWISVAWERKPAHQEKVLVCDGGGGGEGGGGIQQQR